MGSISQTHYDQAIAAADSLLANAPYDPPATMLKARGLIGLGREDQAIDLLTKQVQAQPSDVTNLQFLSRIYQRHGDWPKLVPITLQLSNLVPANQVNMLLLVEAGFRSGNVAAGREASLRLLRPDADPHVIASVLDLWAITGLRRSAWMKRGFLVPMLPAWTGSWPTRAFLTASDIRKMQFR